MTVFEILLELETENVVQYFPKLVSPPTLFDRFSNPNAKIYYTILGIDSEY